MILHLKTTTTQWNLQLTLLLLILLPACDGSSGSKIGSTAPTIRITHPENTATGVERNSIITATFDKEMLAVTVDTDNFTLTTSGSTKTPGNIIFDDTTNMASFTSASPLAPLTTYTATLSTAITDLNGNTLTTNYSWSFTTTDAGAWGNPTQMNSNNAASGTHPQIAADHKGNTLAMWTQHNGSQYNVWSNRFDGSSWGTPEIIGSNSAGAIHNPQIAFDNNGNALAVWSQSNDSHSIWSNHFDGKNWGTAKLIGISDGGNAVLPQIAFDNNGKALSVWSQSDGIRYDIWGNRFDGASWGTATPIGDIKTESVYETKITFDSNNNALAVWSQWNDTRSSIWTSRFDGTSWGTAVKLIETDDVGSQYNSQIAADHNGNALAIWYQNDGIYKRIWTNRFDGSNWGNPEIIDSNDAGGGRSPQIAFDSNGNALAVWQQYNATYGNSIWANRFDGDDNKWGSPEMIESNNKWEAADPQIAFDNNNNALAVWEKSDGSRSSIWANRFNGSNWGSAVQIDTIDATDGQQPKIVFDSNNNALAIWWRQEDETIWVNRFE